MAHRESVVLDGEKIPSVTTILDDISKPGLYYWYGALGTRECERIKKESAAFGSKVHDAIEAYLTDQKPPKDMSERQTNLTSLFTRWAQESNFKTHKTELHVINKADKYHGTFDALGGFGNSKALWILDWKTSNSIYDSYALQLAAYAAAYNNENNLSWETGVNSGGVVRLAKDPQEQVQLEPKTVNGPLSLYYPVFLNLLQVYNFNHKKSSWKGWKTWL